MFGVVSYTCRPAGAASNELVRGRVRFEARVKYSSR